MCPRDMNAKVVDKQRDVDKNGYRSLAQAPTASYWIMHVIQSIGCHERRLDAISLGLCPRLRPRLSSVIDWGKLSALAELRSPNEPGLPTMEPQLWRPRAPGLPPTSPGPPVGPL